MKTDKLPFSCTYLLTTDKFADERGSFSRIFDAKRLAEVGITKPIAQVNHSYTRHKGSFRGFHFQKPPFAEAKLIRCLRGELLDIFIDIRKNSPTFLQHFSVHLNGNTPQTLVLPEGFAHGFQTLTDDVVLIYLHTEFYTPEAEAGINLHDPKINIKLPLPISELSVKDKEIPFLSEYFTGI